MGIETAAVIAGGAVLSGMAGKDKGKTTSTGSSYSNTNQNMDGTTRTQYDTGPWAEQIPYILDTFEKSGGAYGNQDQALKDYMDLGITRYAGPNDAQYTGAKNQYDYATSELQDPYRLENEYNRIAQKEDAQYDAFAGMTQDLYSRGVGDLVSGASEVAQSPYMENAVTSAWDNANRNFQITKDGVGGINSTAASRGTLNSSRAGVAQGVAQAEGSRMGMEAENDLRYNAYNRGLDVAMQERGMDQQIAGMLQTGPSYARTQGITANDARVGQLAGAQMGAGDYTRGLDQISSDNLNALYDKYTGDPWANLQNYSGIVAQPGYGQSGSTQTDQSQRTVSSGTATDRSKGTSGSAMSNSANIFLGML
jgi:hypothetical protein